jgi:hypothetical protein
VDGCEILRQLIGGKHPIDELSNSFNHPFGGLSDFATIQSSMTFISPIQGQLVAFTAISIVWGCSWAQRHWSPRAQLLFLHRWLLGFTRLETLRVHICRTSSLVHRAYKPTNITGGGNTFPISMGLPEDFGEFDGESSFFLMKTATDTPAYNSSRGITCGGHQ